MRKFCIFILSFLLIFVACQPTPEAPLVVPKDQEIMLKKAQEKEDRPTAEELNIPQGRYTLFTSDNTGKLTISVDAELIVPDVSKLTIRTAAMDTLHPEQVKAMYPLLVGDRRLVTQGKFQEAGLVSDGTMTKTKHGYSLAVAEPFPTGASLMATTSSGGDLRFSTAASYSPGGQRYTGTVPENIWPMLGIPYEKAKASVDELMKAAGLNDMTVGQVFLVNDSGTGLSDGDPGQQNSGKKPPAARYAWRFYMARAVDGIPLMTSLSVNPVMNQNELYARNWSYECLCVTVDREGIASLEWISPVAVGPVLQAEVHLLPFGKVMEIFEKMVKVHYSGILSARYPGGTMEVNIDRIELCLVRVRKQGGGDDEGLLVPGWVFYGHTAATDSEGWRSYDFVSLEDGGYMVPVQPQTLLIVNAVDGSIIDPILGY